jgi:hypothetical protein
MVGHALAARIVLAVVLPLARSTRPGWRSGGS